MGGTGVGRGLGSFGASTTGGKFEKCEIEPEDSILGIFVLITFDLYRGGVIINPRE